ncbi:MAG TPA: integrin alpha [Phycisphaerae bacterium]|nr:integrin alpha [Phycisphaerae bacterium]HRR85060.1 integrin alpha [Phycisphaerae bacterium]
MTKPRQIRRSGLSVLVALLSAVPLLVGQGCPPMNWIWPGGDPVGGTGSDSGSGSGQDIPGGTNTPPYFEFTKPLSDVMREVGDIIEIAWLDGDPDDNAVISLYVDPDKIFGNGTEILIESNISENADNSQGFYYLNTTAKGLQPGEYRIIASITDGVNPRELIVAPGLLMLFPPGMVPGNLSPAVVAREPSVNYSVGHNSEVPISWCVSDPDDGENQVLPDIVILLDLDQNPLNDLVFSGSNAERNLAEACFAVQDPLDGPYPVMVDGELRAYVLGCFKDTVGGTLGECSNPTTPGGSFPPNGTYTINAMKLPPRVNGEPYRVRVTAWDHTNPPVSRYAWGGVTVSSTATGNAGLVDLAEVGRTIRGAKFYGFDENGQSGYTGVGVGDMSGDGIDDFVIVSRYGRGYGMDAMGSAHLVLGMAGQQFGGDIPLNSITTTYAGALFTMPYSTKSQGLVSVARVGDVTGDNLSEIVFGAPYTEVFYDRVDDDPCDSSPPSCYFDYMPNPYSDQPPDNDEMGAYDWHEDLIVPQPPPDPPPPPYLCSNDEDLFVQTPIASGYAIVVGSNNSLNNDIYGLEDVGQALGFNGARFRGAYFDDLDIPGTLTGSVNRTWPYSIIPDNLFGLTVNSMPSISDSTPGLTARWGPSLVISSPKNGRNRGRVWYFEWFDYTSRLPGSTTPDIQSFPALVGCGFRTRIIPGGTDGTGRSGSQVITGEMAGDLFGYAGPAGDFNRDGSQDIVAGAPGADRNGLIDNGIVYVVFGRPDFDNPDMTNLEEFDLDIWNSPRLEIHGDRNNDRFGESQTLIGDVNQDGHPDIAFASQYAGSDGIGGPESGFIGIVFGGRHFAGVNKFNVGHVGGPTLPGVRIYGRQAGGHAGAVINDVGDFNADGIDDLVIVAPDEIRLINGLRRQGVAYLLFGGPHLANKTINLSQVGSTVPGLVFVTPYGMTDANAARITWASGAGDVNGDGFDDILLGLPEADTVYPYNPSLRKVDTGEMYLIYGSNSGTNGMSW